MGQPNSINNEEGIGEEWSMGKTPEGEVKRLFVLSLSLLDNSSIKRKRLEE